MGAVRLPDGHEQREEREDKYNGKLQTGIY